MIAVLNTRTRRGLSKRTIDWFHALYVRHLIDNVELDIRDMKRNPYAAEKQVRVFERHLAELRVELAVLERRK